MKRKGNRRLGRVQAHVLHVLASRGKSSVVDRGAFYPLAVEQVRAAIASLADRGLVDVAGFERGSGSREVRTYALTARGRELERSMVHDAGGAGDAPRSDGGDAEGRA